MDYSTIILTEQKGIVTLTFNRPDRRNALNRQMYLELGHALRALAGKSDLRVLVLTGAGKAFCAGGDVPELYAAAETIEKARERLTLSHGAMAALGALGVPTIAAVNGDAMGGGCSLALACDLRIASERARFGLTQVRVGLAPDLGASFFLSRLVGPSKACELCFLGNIIDAREAHGLGLVNTVVSADELPNAATELAEKLAAGPAIAMTLAKRAIFEAANLNLAAALQTDISNIAMCLSSADGREGLRAFIEKRPAAFGKG